MDHAWRNIDKKFRKWESIAANSLDWDHPLICKTNLVIHLITVSCYQIQYSNSGSKGNVVRISFRHLLRDSSSVAMVYEQDEMCSCMSCYTQQQSLQLVTIATGQVSWRLRRVCKQRRPTTHSHNFPFEIFTGFSKALLSSPIIYFTRIWLDHSAHFHLSRHSS